MGLCALGDLEIQGRVQEAALAMCIPHHFCLVLQVMKGGPDEPALLEDVVINDEQLVWDSDREDFFSDKPPENLNVLTDFRGGRMLDDQVAINQDEHFMHWMRPAAHPGVLPPLPHPRQSCP